MSKSIYCTQCEKDVNARLTNGEEIYPHRFDLSDTPFWICDPCGNYVGCHHKTKERTKPLGVIPTVSVRALRSAIHKRIDPYWRGGGMYTRTEVYKIISDELGYQFHTANIRTESEARQVLDIVNDLFGRH